MKSLACSLVAIMLASVSSTPVLAKKPVSSPQQQVLNTADAQLAAQNSPPGQSKRPSDPDQGDDNANPMALATVCSKDTPAAERSAICTQTPVSPQ